MPYLLFKVLDTKKSAEHSKEIACRPACIRDWLSTVLLEKCPEPENITSAECLAILESIAAMLDCDIAEIESRHAQTICWLARAAIS